MSPDKKQVLPKTSVLEAGPGPSFLNESVVHRYGRKPFSMFSLQHPMADLLIAENCMSFVVNYEEGLVSQISRRPIKISWGPFPRLQCHHK